MIQCFTNLTHFLSYLNLAFEICTHKTICMTRAHFFDNYSVLLQNTTTDISYSSILRDVKCILIPRLKFLVLFARYANVSYE